NTSTSTTIVRCPSTILSRLRRLNEAEIITLFTPFVSHPPSTVLARNMDPFEPLGRALPRQVRHIPYRLDAGMTEYHTDFLPSSGAVIMVLCATENVISRNAQAFEQQIKFAQNILRKVHENKSLANIPVVLLLFTNSAASQVHEDQLSDFPVLVSCDDYTPDTFGTIVRLVFGM
ncbi:hypothetical protein K504DRAFT_350742, partial [Pleomassaria siparia CBS 279.74]